MSMFSLKQKKNITPNKETQGLSTNQKACKQSKERKEKPTSKKVGKTVFEDPFIYRIELLPHEQTTQLVQLLTQYLTKLREILGLKPVQLAKTKTIKFEMDKNIKPALTPLISPQIVIGVKRTKRVLYNYHQSKRIKTQNLQEMPLKDPQLVLIFYDQKKHQVLEELLCLLKIVNLPYLLVRQQPEITRLLGVRTVGSLCLYEEIFANSLLKYLGKCLINIPWLIEIQHLCENKEQF